MSDTNKMSEEELKELQELEEELEEFDDLPEEWIHLVKTIPDLIYDFVDDKRHTDDMLPEYFFNYFEDDYKECEPFFTCFECGEEVFRNFYGIYGDSVSDYEKELSDEDIMELVRKHIKGMNYLLASKNFDQYDIDSVTIKVMSSINEAKEIIPEWEDYEDIESSDERYDVMGIMIDELPEEEDNPISAFWEPLYEQTQSFYIRAYIIWPLVKQADIENPFEAYKILWENSIDIYTNEEGELVAVKPSKKSGR